MNNTQYKQRRAEFCKLMKKESFALLTSGFAPYKGKDQLHPFFVNRNFYYLTGLQRERFVLVLLNSEKSHYEFLFIEEPSDYATKWLGSRLTKAEASEISGINELNIFYMDSLDGFIANRILMDSRSSIVKQPRHLYLDLFREYLMKKPSSLIRFNHIIETYPELKIKDANPILDEQRRLKSSSEVEEIRKAIGYTNKGIQALQKTVKPGMNERQLEALFEYTIKMAGSSGVSFETISASGKNATILHYVDNNQEIKNNTLILNDLGALSNEYAADITRTYPANGKFTVRQKEIYSIVLHTNKEIIKMVKPGVTFKELNVKAYDLLAEGLIKLGKIKEKSELTKYYYHSIGHYLGLDVHDVGSNLKALEPGAIITVEPGLYIEEEAIGIRIEDDVLVTENGCINLSEEIIKEIDDIEAYMKK
ncbi:aminopeptidase P family protein [Candidatus Izemoplasma sp. B36]|uniref:aminopeptidase P family protein n=1 Tax=Candidatus Izemoplasma sp. B36 TaxID=3242468 RepID=UPI003555D729